MSDRSFEANSFGSRPRTRGIAAYEMFAHGDRGPMIDLQLVRHNRITAREYNRMWEHVLALFTLQGSRLTSEALRILVNAEDIHVRAIRAEFRSYISLLQNDDDRYSMEFERDTEISELTRVKGIGEADLIARRADMQSPLRVATKVVNVLLKMETTRRAFSRTIQAFARIRQ
ncbi:uncharacterized protein LOC127867217 isoform X2 [Dreissena polymorpha]|uniref:Uncharacterized protein n=3 Tax=Dreissena polymorpha TaxID=45954 RepID=A0A9D4LW60_DREPO|nr:uncharacterized protein LOC127867217 isoform X2 [Dreissena polymorpha]KAH3866212.1 hypothetical protein DPMN_029270 [Dreissena polymorpha]